MTCFKHIYSGGEKMEPDVEEKINNLLKQCGAETRLYNCLGSTEMMAGATILYDNCYKRGSVGIPMVKVECAITEPDSDKELPYDNEGEICFSGSTLMMGYYNKPEETDAIVRRHADGQRWLHTGDLGYMDQDGLLYITGRIKRIFMTRGRDGNVTKVFPDRIEGVISHHEAVELCCAIGVPDEERIHKPMAFVVLKPGAWDEARVREEILALCGKELPAYMVPEAVACREDLPRTPRGKIDYRALEAVAASQE